MAHDTLPYKPPGNCIFIHIPKTAGISIYESVLELERPFDWFYGLNTKYLNNLLRDQTKLKSIHPRVDKAKTSVRSMLKESTVHSWPLKGSSMLGHIHYQALIEDKKLTQDYFDDSFKFAFVRNPYDRLVSLYKYHRIQKLLNLDFDAFVYTLSQEFQAGRVPPVGLYNIQPFPETSPLHHLTIYGNQYNPMMDWLPKDFQQTVLLCYLETFEQDIDKLLNMVGFQGKREAVPKKNKSKYEDNFMDFYTKRETIDLVSQLYKDDFEAFGYDLL
jgi:chondroitin 4-sulfotransferase 11